MAKSFSSRCNSQSNSEWNPWEFHISESQGLTHSFVFFLILGLIFPVITMAAKAASSSESIYNVEKEKRKKKLNYILNASSYIYF